MPLHLEISSLLSKEAIIQIPSDSTDGFFSHYFAVPKNEGGIRPIMDLRDLNQYILHKKFRMLTLDSILPLLSQGNWFVTIDLQDVYSGASLNECLV